MIPLVVLVKNLIFAFVIDADFDLLIVTVGEFKTILTIAFVTLAVLLSATVPVDAVVTPV